MQQFERIRRAISIMTVTTSEIWIKKNKSASKIQELKIKLKVSMNEPNEIH